MKVLLINSNLKNDLLAAPPIGLCYVATSAKAAGHDVRLLDLCFKKDVESELKHGIKDFSPDCIGLSVRNIDNVNMLHPVSYLPDVRRMIDYIREISDSPIVLGGSAASLNPVGVLESLKADFIVVSDGEDTFVKLLSSLENRTLPQNVPGVGMIIDGHFHLTPAVHKSFSNGRANLGQWVDMKPYTKIGSSYNIQSKRGCRHRCIYCVYQIIQGHGIRVRDPIDVVDELEEAYYKYKPTDFEFVDSVFNEPVDHAAQILEEICRRSWKVRFTAIGINPAYLDTKFLDLMWRAGFRSFMLSPESMSEKVISNYGKDFNVDDVIRATEAINKTRFTTLWYFLLGGPGENNQTLQDSLDFILKYLKHDKHPPYHNINMFMGVRIYPGTELWEIARQENFVNGQTDPLEPCWYLSPELDLEIAIKQMIETAVVCPELYLGFDESIIGMSRLWTLLGRIFRVPKPYWRHIWGINKLLLKCGIRFAFQPDDVVSIVRRQLEQQGYRGPLLKGNS